MRNTIKQRTIRAFQRTTNNRGHTQEPEMARPRVKKADQRGRPRQRWEDRVKEDSKLLVVSYGEDIEQRKIVKTAQGLEQPQISKKIRIKDNHYIIMFTVTVHKIFYSQKDRINSNVFFNMYKKIKIRIQPKEPKYQCLYICPGNSSNILCQKE